MFYLLLISGPCYGPECFFLGSQESDQFALLVMLSIWVLYNRSSEMVSPRYFVDETLTSMVSRKKVLGLNGSFKASDMKDLAFRGIKIHIPQLFPFFKVK